MLFSFLIWFFPFDPPHVLHDEIVPIFLLRFFFLCFFVWFLSLASTFYQPFGFLILFIDFCFIGGLELCMMCNV